MKMHSLLIAVAFIAFISFAVGANETQTLRRGKKRKRWKRMKCVVLLKHVLYDQGHENAGLPKEQWECAAQGKNKGGKILEFQDRVEDLDIDLQPFDSGNTLMTIEGARVLPNGKIKIRKGSEVKIDKTENGNRANGVRNLFSWQPRRLTVGTRKVIVVRVIDTVGLATTSSAARISDEVFGNGYDQNNMVSQYKACSFGKLNFSPVTELELNGSGLTQFNAAGVYEVTIPIDATGKSHATVREAITNQLDKEWTVDIHSSAQGISGSNLPFNHVMYCLPPGIMSGVAYTYMNHWLSIFNNEQCERLSAQMHEIGHNIGLGHSGEEEKDGHGAEYGDTSGMMGYTYDQDDSPKKCFNAAKSWQLGWYDDRHTTIRPLVTSSWTGRLMGITDYQNPANFSVILKIATDDPTDFQYYVNFNRKAGMNSESNQGGDKVMLTRQKAAGQSKLMSILDSGDSSYIRNFAGSGTPVQIKVNEINTSSSLYYADITVVYGCNVDVQCGPGPTFACTVNTCNPSTQRCEEAQPAGCDCDNTCSLQETASSCPSDCGVTSELKTETKGGSDHAGNMFDVITKYDIQITRFHIHAEKGGENIYALVYTKTGTYHGYEKDNSRRWTLIQTATVPSQGQNNLTPLPLLDNPLVIRAKTKQAFYITLSSSDTISTVGSKVGAVYAEDGNLQFFEGVGVAYPFGYTSFPRIWNGIISYTPAPTSPPVSKPAPASTPRPAPQPTLAPVTPAPAPVTPAPAPVTLTPAPVTLIPAPFTPSQAPVMPQVAPVTLIDAGTIADISMFSPITAAAYGNATSLAPLHFRTHRWAKNLTYTLKGFVSGATYKVSLGFAEIYRLGCVSGRRIMDAKVNGLNVKENLDVFALTGCETPHVETVIIQADEAGSFQIEIIGKAQNAMISLIEISLASTAAPSLAPVKPTSAPITPAPVQIPQPTANPLPAPTPQETSEPTPQPTRWPTHQPVPEPTPQLTGSPITSAPITPAPVQVPQPTANPLPAPTPQETSEPNPQPTRWPTHQPVPEPTPQLTGSPITSTVPTLGLGVEAFILVDANTNQDIPGALECTPSACLGTSNKFNIRASVSGNAKSVMLKIDGPVKRTQLESAAPFTLFGDRDGKYNGDSLPVGTYTITGQAFDEVGAKGTASQTLTKTFSIVAATQPHQPTPQPALQETSESTPQPTRWPTHQPVPEPTPQLTGSPVKSTVSTLGLGVEAFILVDANTNQDITGALECTPSACLGSSNKFNIRVSVSGSTKSVMLKIVGPIKENRVESVAPYALFGDIAGKYNGYALPVGTYTITGQAFSEVGAKGTASQTLTKTFSIQ